MAPLFVLFVLFSPLWWALLLVASIGIITSLELNENSGSWATACFAISLALLSFFGQPTIPALLVTNPLWFTLSIAGTYIVCAGVYGVAMWTWFVHKKRDTYEQIKLDWLRKHNVPNKEVPDALKANFGLYLLDSCDKSWIVSTWTVDENGRQIKTRTIDPRPRPWNHASEITVWMIYWPWSLVWNLCHDMVINIFKGLRKLLVNMMEDISKRVFRNVSNDFVINSKK